MTIRARKKNEKIVIDLNGPDGNAFVLIGIVLDTFRRAGAPEMGRDIVEEMKKGDYENLLQVFDRYLGDYFDLVR